MDIAPTIVRDWHLIPPPQIPLGEFMALGWEGGHPPLTNPPPPQRLDQYRLDRAIMNNLEFFYRATLC